MANADCARLLAQELVLELAMTQPQTQNHSDAQLASLSSTQEAPAAAAPEVELARVGHQTPGLVVIPQLEADGTVGMKVLLPTGESVATGVDHAESGEPLTWSALASAVRDAAVSGWFPAKLGGWVKLDWRDGGFAADAWTSDGTGMKAYDAAMRAKKRS